MMNALGPDAQIHKYERVERSTAKVKWVDEDLGWD